MLKQTTSLWKKIDWKKTMLFLFKSLWILLIFILKKTAKYDQLFVQYINFLKKTHKFKTTIQQFIIYTEVLVL